MAKPKKLRVYYIDEREVDVVITMKVRTDTEDHFGLAMSELSYDKHAAHMAWLALRDSGAEEGDFESFCEAVFDIGPVDDGDKTAGPTGSAQPPDTSSS